MSVERVRSYFRERGLEQRIREFDVSSATVELAAQAVGCEGKQIAKTLSFRAGDRILLIVTAGDAKVDNHKFKARFAAKARMLPADETESLIGYSVGGVCPFAVNPGVEVYLDESLKRFETVFPAAGSASSAIELTPAELKEHSAALDWVDVCTGWE
jgi:prolyl-tRNA editing enzyme YbaK/EbsC (Cys-tRNA(Pro) deacylase)